MIGSVLKRDIDAYAERLRRSSRLFELAEAGAVTKDVVAVFLVNIHYVLSEAPRYIELGRRVAEGRGQAELVRFFAGKLAEESGHEQWAAQDLERLAWSEESARASRPSASLLELMAYLRELVRNEPALLLVYLLFGEYSTVLLAPDWVELLARNCGISSGALTSLTRHVELDREHVADDLDTLARLWPAQVDELDARRALARFMAHWERFYDELAALPS